MRHFFGAVAFIGVFVLGFFVYFVPTEAYPNGQLDPSAYGRFSAWLALAMTVTVLYSAWGTQDRLPYLPTAHPNDRFSLQGLLADTAEALQNRSFRWVIIGFVIIIVAFGAAGALNMYMLTFFWAFDAGGIAT